VYGVVFTLIPQFCLILRALYHFVSLPPWKFLVGPKSYQARSISCNLSKSSKSYMCVRSTFHCYCIAYLSSLLATIEVVGRPLFVSCKEYVVQYVRSIKELYVCMEYFSLLYTKLLNFKSSLSFGLLTTIEVVGRTKFVSSKKYLVQFVRVIKELHVCTEYFSLLSHNFAYCILSPCDHRSSLSDPIHIKQDVSCAVCSSHQIVICVYAVLFTLIPPVCLI
jgi:hypothetical protein